MFASVLVANRGEIACRIIRTLRSMGIRSVAVYSDADKDARHVSLADVAIRLGGARAAESYLDADRIVAAALESGAQAIHPGYGFLAESATFAAACAKAGIVFVGPGAKAIEVMGDKIRARHSVSERDVPVVPGIAEPGLTDEQLIAAAPTIGLPILIKPSAGGGGKGMHVVSDLADLPSLLATARREAGASFGDDSLFLERYVLNPRHIEVQVLADNQGTTVHLGERECSLQRRHQKVIEEAPSALLDEATRERIGAAACETARSVGYVGAGTVEFIVSADAPDEFFFMEMNTRLQVEHPVTELVTGLDLVEQQLRLAAGEPLTFTQQDVKLTGHAIEARVYAEDPAHGFLPTGGTVAVVEEPSGTGVRVDSALVPGLVVGSDYDPMLAKVIAWGGDRASAISRLSEALGSTVVLGVRTNVEFLRMLLADPDVRSGDMDTGLIERRLPEWTFAAAGAREYIAAALLRQHAANEARTPGPWSDGSGWRLGGGAQTVHLLRSGDSETVEVRVSGALTDAAVSIDGAAAVRASIRVDRPHALLTVDGRTNDYAFSLDPRAIELAADGITTTIVLAPRPRRAGEADPTERELRSPMPGSVISVLAEHGSTLEAGEPVLIIEAMKMEHVLRAPFGGIVELRVVAGEQVGAGQLVAEVRKEGEE